LHWATRLVSIPWVNQCTRCAEEPWVKDSGVTYPRVCSCKRSSNLKTSLTPQTCAVAAVTIANGGDNIGIYIPLFASSSLPQLAIILGVFFLLVGVWCFVAERLARQKAIAPGLTQYGDRIVPFVFIALGLYILVDSETYRLFPLR
jgi:cadmium resistance protein CadD (predicted permease)